MSIFELLQPYLSNRVIDSHCHLNSNSFDEDRNEVVKRAKLAGIEVWDMAVDIKTSIKSLDYSLQEPYVKVFAGIDPEVFNPGSELYTGFSKADEYIEDSMQKLEELLKNHRGKEIIGIGESGMDFYWFEHSNSSPDAELIEKSKQYQEVLFRKHLELGEKYLMPLSIHSRGAEKICIEIVKGYNTYCIFHSYTGEYDVAKLILDSGNGLGINGIFTFKSATSLREVYKKILGTIPRDVGPEWFYQRGIYFETDAPYLSPEGKRGARNEPINVGDIFKNLIQFFNS